VVHNLYPTNCIQPEDGHRSNGRNM